MSIYRGPETRLRKSAARSRALTNPHCSMRVWRLLLLVIPVADWTGESRQQLPAELQGVPS